MTIPRILCLMGPIRRTISLICALGLTLASAAWLIYPWLTNGGLVLGWRPAAAAVLLVAGLFWLWEDFIKTDPRPEK
jgi:hypothetical protein